MSGTWRGISIFASVCNYSASWFEKLSPDGVCVHFWWNICQRHHWNGSTSCSRWLSVVVRQLITRWRMRSLFMKKLPAPSCEWVCNSFTMLGRRDSTTDRQMAYACTFSELIAFPAPEPTCTEWLFVFIIILWIIWWFVPSFTLHKLDACMHKMAKNRISIF